MVEKFPSEQQDRYIVRFPDGMRDKLKSLAASHGRSLNAEIIAHIQFAIDFDDKLNGQAPEIAAILDKKLDDQRSLILETREEMAAIKEWLRAGKPKIVLPDDPEASS